MLACWRLDRPFFWVAPSLAALFLVVSSTAFAQGRLEAHYTASVGGIPVGRATWLIDIGDSQYTGAAMARTAGLLQVFSAGRGSAIARGAMKAGHPAPSSYTVTVTSEHKTDEVRMTLSGGAIKKLIALPVWPETPDRVPVTEAHRHGVLDPMSALLIPAAGKGDPVSPDACRRTLPIFDGRARYDLVLSFKRMATVKAEKGYTGAAVVCGVSYHPISGHRPNRPAIRYIMAQHDMEVWLAPVPGTRILVPFRVSVPTAIGVAVLEATQFVGAPGPSRPPATSAAKTQ